MNLALVLVTAKERVVRLLSVSVEHLDAWTHPLLASHLGGAGPIGDRWIYELAACIAPRLRAMVLVAAFGGLRSGEIAAFRRAHIIPEGNQICVKATLVDVKGHMAFGPPITKTSLRTVTIPRSIMAELVEHMDTYTGEGADALVFTGERGVAIRRSRFWRYYGQPATTAAGWKV